MEFISWVASARGTPGRRRPRTLSAEEERSFEGFVLDRERGPDGGVAGVGGKGEAPGHDADDSVGDAVDGDGAADDLGIGVVDIVPGSGAEEDDAGLAGGTVGGQEGAAHHGPDLEHVEEIGAGDDLRHDPGV